MSIETITPPELAHTFANRSEMTNELLVHSQSTALKDGQGVGLGLKKLPNITSPDNPGGQGLRAVVRAGDELFGVVRVPGAQDAPEGYFLTRFSLGGESEASVVGEIKVGETLNVGRTMLERSGVQDVESDMSRNHFSVQLIDGRLAVRDSYSSNGTEVLVPRDNTGRVSQSGVAFRALNIARKLRAGKQPSMSPWNNASLWSVPESQSVGVEPRAVLPAVVDYSIDVPRSAEHHSYPSPQEAIHMFGHEFTVDQDQYRYDGPTRRGYAFTSTDESGRKRTFFVYRSESEGGWRASQGGEPNGRGGHRFMKGPEASSKAQYTQDTQLNPKFEQAAMVIIMSDAMPKDPAKRAVYNQMHQANTDRLNRDATTAIELIEDFESQVQYLPLGSPRLDELLNQVKAGCTSLDEMRRAVGIPHGEREQVWSTYQQKLGAINEALRQEGVMPDFAGEPIDMYADEHPKLGTVLTEVFAKVHNGSVVEWHIKQDTKGRVWIDRIRLSGADSTPYGTDRQLLSSGVLTSKAVEYTAQVDGLPRHMHTEIDHNYSDASAFLNELLPIQEYRRYYGNRASRYVHLMNARS